MEESNERGLRVLVCGATGYLGGYVAQVAKARGHWVRVLVRSKSSYGARAEAVDEVFEGKATDASTLAGLCDGVDVVFSALGNRTLKRKPDCWQVDYQANMNIVERAVAAGVKQIVFVSVLHGARTRAFVPQIEARERVVDALITGRTPWTVIRPSGFFNDMSEMLEMARKGTVWVVGNGNEPFNPVHGADLAAACVDTFANERDYRREIPVGGPGVLTMREIAAAAFEAVGRKPKIRAVPIWMLKFLATIIKPFNINVASLLFMFTAFAGGDAVTDRYGSHHIEDFFKEQVAKSKGGGLAVRT